LKHLDANIITYLFLFSCFFLVGKPVVADQGTANNIIVDTFACSHQNLAQNAAVKGTNTNGQLTKIIDGHQTFEGSRWILPAAVQLKNKKAAIFIDFHQVYPISAFKLQADADDVYKFQFATDTNNWKGHARIPKKENQDGLHTRKINLNQETTIRYLLITPIKGDGNYSISELKAYCRQPDTTDSSEPTPNGTNQEVNAGDNLKLWFVKTGLATIGLIWLVWNWFTSKKQSIKASRNLGTEFIILGTVSCFAWFNLTTFHNGNFYHYWEFFHYYMGSKYQPELGYVSLYDASVIADWEHGYKKSVRSRHIRDLSDNSMIPATQVLDDSTTIKEQLGKRWKAFKSDALWFRGQMSEDRWKDMHQDHGFNATPVWTIVGKTLTNTGSINKTQIFWLSLIDPILIIIMWILVAWAFGWEVFSLALIFWGTNLVANFHWTGGSFLRQNWLVFLVIGICLLKKQKNAGGGFMLLYSAFLRIFPGATLLGVALKGISDTFYQKQWWLQNQYQKVFKGLVAAFAVLIPLSLWVNEGFKNWKGFITNSQKHLETPLSNHMGLKTILGYSHQDRAEKTKEPAKPDPFAKWKEKRLENFEDLKFIYWAAILLYLTLLIRVLPRIKPWEAAVLGTGLIPIAFELTCYYYGFFLVYAFLFHKKYWIGIALCLISIITHLVNQYFDWYGFIYTLNTIPFIIFVFLLLIDYNWNLGQKLKAGFQNTWKKE